MKALLCDTKIQLYDWWALKLSVNWKWTMFVETTTYSMDIQNDSLYSYVASCILLIF